MFPAFLCFFYARVPSHLFAAIVCVCRILTGRHNGVLHFAFGNALYKGSRILCETDTEDIKHLVMFAVGNFASICCINFKDQTNKACYEKQTKPSKTIIKT